MDVRCVWTLGILGHDRTLASHLRRESARTRIREPTAQKDSGPTPGLILRPGPPGISTSWAICHWPLYFRTAGFAASSSRPYGPRTYFSHRLTKAAMSGIRSTPAFSLMECVNLRTSTTWRLRRHASLHLKVLNRHGSHGVVLLGNPASI